jgi:hypothetical protein
MELEKMLMLLQIIIVFVDYVANKIKNPLLKK